MRRKITRGVNDSLDKQISCYRNLRYGNRTRTADTAALARVITKQI